jgi:hypothetical protein
MTCWDGGLTNGRCCDDQACDFGDAEVCVDTTYVDVIGCLLNCCGGKLVSVFGAA